MLTLTFTEFAEGSKFPDFVDFSLYVVRNDNSILYIGISQSNIWNRWFSAGYCHMRQTEYGEWHGNSLIGQEIVSHLPQSEKWEFDFWSLKEALDFMSIDYIYQSVYAVCLHPVSKEQLSIKDVEPEMIAMLCPKLNKTYNHRKQKDELNNYLSMLKLFAHAKIGV